MKLLVAALPFLVQCDNTDGSDLPPVPVVTRTTEQVAFVEERTLENADCDFYRNDAYDCGLTGKYTFMVINPMNGGDKDEAPLWVYLHGGGSGYWDEEGTYFAVGAQTEDTWNHEETFDDLIHTLTIRNFNGGRLEDNTLTRRLKEGHRMLVVAMCDHDQYLGMGTLYPNNPTGPNAEVNGLQATMAAVDYTAAHYPTTHVFVHGTSAGSVGAYAVGLSYAAEDVALTGVICDSILGSRGAAIQAQLAGKPGFPQQAGYDPDALSAKVGVWREAASRLDPESRIGAGFHGTPILQIGGLLDTQCAGDREPLPEASADGFENNCEWLAQPLKDLIAAQPGSLHRVAEFEGEGHVPTINPGASHDVVDAFMDRVLSKYSALPFGGEAPSSSSAGNATSSAAALAPLAGPAALRHSLFGFLFCVTSHFYH